MLSFIDFRVSIAVGERPHPVCWIRYSSAISYFSLLEKIYIGIEFCHLLGGIYRKLDLSLLGPLGSPTREYLQNLVLCNPFRQN